MIPSASALRVLAVTATLAAAAADSLAARTPQTAKTRLSFEVASIKANRSNAPAASLFLLGAGDAYVDGNRFSASNQPLIAYLLFGFKLGPGDLTGLPSWIYTDRFDTEARRHSRGPMTTCEA